MLNVFLIYIVISFLVFFVVAKISNLLNFVDRPSKRKIHLKKTPFTGGIAISIMFILSDLIFHTINHKLQFIVSISFLISLVGLMDDKLDLNVGGKLALLIIPITYLILNENLYLITLGNYNYFNLNLGFFGIPFTLLAILLLINAFNYFDGMDGTLSFSLISILFIFYFLIDDDILRFYLIILFIPLAIFLFFNFNIFNLPKIFLGDNGSLMLGFIVSFCLIYIANEKLVHPIILAWSIVIFVYEFLSINLIRLKKKKNIFQGNQDHLHHILFYKTKSVLLTNLIIVMINISFFTIGYLTFFISPIISLLLFIILFFYYLFLRIKYSKQPMKIKL